jgi:uncharacterized membrane protein YeaQ/YmgE (transglycosylase-associated protein family)
MTLFQKEPAVIIGIIAAAIIAVVQSLQGNGVLDGSIADIIANAISPESGWLLPIIIGIVTRFAVFSPAKAAELKAEVPPGYVPAKS